MLRLPAPREGILVESFGDGAVVFEPVSALLHVLNPQAALIMQGCINGWSLTGLVDDVAEASGVDPLVVATDIEACLARLRHLDVLAATAGHAPPVASAANGDAEADVAACPASPVAGEPPGSRARAGDGSPVRAAGRADPARPAALSSRSLAVLDEVVAFRGDDRELLNRVDTLFEDLVVEDAPTQEWALTVADDEARLVGPAAAGAVFHDADALVDHLPTILNEVAATSTTCLALHAGAVRSPEGEVVLLPAVSGSGKSTLTAWLVQHGWAYLSDETAAVRSGSLTVVPYPKPLVLDDVGRSLLGLNRSTSPNVRAAEVRPGAAVRPGDQPRVGRIVLVTYEPGAETAVVPLEPDTAVLAVAEHALNLRWTGTSGLATLVELVTTVPCHRLTHGGLDEAQAALTTLSG